MSPATWAIVGLHGVTLLPQEGTISDVRGTLKERVMRGIQNHATKCLESQGEALPDTADLFAKAFGNRYEKANDIFCVVKTPPMRVTFFISSHILCAVQLSR